MTPDVLRDYMLGHLGRSERKRVRARLRVDPSTRGALRRLRKTTVRVRARLGRVDAVQQLPDEWLALIERAGSRAHPRVRTSAEEERSVSWLRSGADPSDERELTWL